MEYHQIIFGVVLIVILLAMATFFAWHQGKALRGLQQAQDLSPEDRRYTRNQAWRRLICSALMVVLAVLLAASFFLEEGANKLVTEGEANRERGTMRELAPEELRFFNFYRTYWAVASLVLLGIISLAAVDYIAIRRYGRRHYKQIQSERKTMIENELARLRSQRNGHND